jgi:hypothetical protein
MSAGVVAHANLLIMSFDTIIMGFWNRNTTRECEQVLHVGACMQ